MINDASVVIGGGNWGIKEADVLGYKLINDEYYARDIDFANSTAAGTYTDSTGLIRKAPYNLFTFSEQFENADWSKQGLTATANAAIAPNGTLTAELLDDGTAATTQHWIYQFTSLINSTSYTISFYAKYVSRRFMTVNIFNGVTSQYVDYDLQNGIVSGSTGDVTASITSVGNGWYRLTYTRTTAATGGPNFRIAMADDTGSESYTGSNKQVLLWGAQLVEGTEALPYFPTTTRLNVPRIDYRNADGSLSTVGRLLLEPQRTNLVTYSEQLNNADWVKADATVTANTSVSPDGYTNADKLVENSANAIHFVGSNSGSVTAGSHTASVFAKAAERNILQMFFNGSSNITAYANFNLTTGAVTGSDSSTATIESFGNGWYRCTITATLSTSVVPLMYCCLQTSPTAARAASYLGNGTSGVLLWGAQLEAGAYPTTYIPTTTAAVTRNADSASRTGVSSWIGQTEGVLFYDFVWNGNPVALGDYPVMIYGASYSDFLGLSTYESSPAFYSYVGGSNIVAIGGATMVVGQRYKMAMAYKLNDYAFYVNGSLVGVDTSAGIPPSMANLRTDNPFGGRVASTGINQAILFKTRLTNEQLSQLTTL